MGTGLDYAFGQMEYEKCLRIMSALPREELEKGCRVFERYGIDYVQNGECCFVGYMFDNDWSKISFEISYEQDIEKLYWAHYYCPEIVFLVASELLEKEK